MGIVNWFINDLNAEERTLTRDLISVAIADNEFGDEEKEAILKSCQAEGISLVELMDSIRNETATSKSLHTTEEKKRYLLHLVRTMSADGEYRSLELKVVEIIAKKLGVAPIFLLSFVLDEMKDNKIGQAEGVSILDHFVKHFIATGL